MDDIRYVLANTDWAMLAKQKQRLLLDADDDLVMGVVHFIDAIQDAAQTAGYPVVWLTEGDE
jgi:hypothetical protein